MPSLYGFIQAALLAAQQEPDSSPTPVISSSTGSELQSNVTVQKSQSRFSVRPVQIAQGEERQAIQYSTPSEGREELKEIKVGQRRCEISTTNAKSQQELLKEDFTESAETEEKTEEFTESAETEEFNIKSKIPECSLFRILRK